MAPLVVGKDLVEKEFGGAGSVGRYDMRVDIKELGGLRWACGCVELDILIWERICQ